MTPPIELFLRSSLCGSSGGSDRGEGAFRSNSSEPRLEVRGVATAVDEDDADEMDCASARRDRSDADESDEWDERARVELFRDEDREGQLQTAVSFPPDAGHALLPFDDRRCRPRRRPSAAVDVRRSRATGWSHRATTAGRLVRRRLLCSAADGRPGPLRRMNEARRGARRAPSARGA
jgi:hypothetical protein